MFQELIVAAISIILLGLIAIAARIIQNRRRAQRLWEGLRSALPGPLRLRLAKDRHLQIAEFAPAPDPFQKLQAELERSLYQPRLVIRGKLNRRIQEELLWLRGRPPARALRRSVDAGLWETRRIDLLDGEFAVRGTNTSALEHVFFDMQARFGAFLQRVSVLVEEDEELRVELDVSRFNESDVPALVTTIRALGRAALR